MEKTIKLEKNSYLCTMIQKTIQRNSFWAIALFAVLVLKPSLAGAQEMVKKAIFQKTEFALVRDRNLNRQWVVYNDMDYYFNFGLLDTSGVNNYFIKTEPRIHVKDMEIVADTLFFCGSIENDTTSEQTGILGFFAISRMPSPTIHYLKIDSMKVLNKLDYYSMNKMKHYAMIGTGKNGLDYIVDAFYGYGPWTINPGVWGVNRTRVPNVNAIFDDIATSGGKVVVSGRILDSVGAYLFYMDRTPLSGVPFYMSSSIGMERISSSYPHDRVLMQSMSGDTLFTVFKSGINLYVRQFKGTENIYSRQIMMPFISLRPLMFATGYPMDVKTDKTLKNINILFFIQLANSNEYWVYNIPKGLMATGGNINVHRYQGEYMPFSLGRSLDNTTLSVGVYSGEWSIARLQNNAAGNCATVITNDLDPLSNVPENVFLKNHFPEYLARTIDIMAIDSVNVSMMNVCF